MLVPPLRSFHAPKGGVPPSLRTPDVDEEKHHFFSTLETAGCRLYLIMVFTANYYATFLKY